MHTATAAIGRWLAATLLVGVASVWVLGGQVTSTAAVEITPLADIDGSADATEPAERLHPPARTSIAVVGDSISWIARRASSTGGGTLASTLDGAGWSSVTIEAKPSRSIWYPWEPVYSGVHTVRAMKAAGADPDAWLIELGTNDIYWVNGCTCTDPVAWSVERIRLMLSEIGPGETVYWVNVRRWNYTTATIHFNTALRQLVESGEVAAVVDWYATSTGKRSSWFVDEAHLNSTGYRAWLTAIATIVQPE